MTPEEARSLGRAIRTARSAKGLTQLKLAVAVGVKSPWISAWERGQSQPAAYAQSAPPVASLPDIDPTAPGAYRVAITELGEDRAVELLHDLRNAGRNPRRYRNSADGKPRYGGGMTSAQRYRK